MRKVVLILIIAFIFFGELYAQEKYSRFKLDTININGVVYDHMGKPLPGVLIFVKGKVFPKRVYTDKEGKFELNGAEAKDSIIAETLTNLKIIKNNGSRYIWIEFPVDPRHNQGLNDIQITTKRKLPKRPAPEIITPVEYGFPNYGRTAYFLGGINKFEALIKDNISYPERAVENNIEGDVEIGFIIDNDGSLNKFKVLRGIGYGCEEQVIKAIKASPKWIPAINAGKPVAIPSFITINFKLTDK